MAIQTQRSLVDWLDDLSVRFIINLPEEELQSVERICFQVEEAQWYYEDFIRPLDPSLPSLNLRNFCLLIFQHCPLLSQFSTHHHLAAFSEFLAYKTRVPVRGAILLNAEMNKVILVRGWKKGANWSFPRGKINKGEGDFDCAIREVYEETGFNIGTSDLVPAGVEPKFIKVTMREQHIQLYVIRGIPMNTYLQPVARKEIGEILWYNLSDLPTLKKDKKIKHGTEDESRREAKFYMVAPFMGPLKKWIAEQQRIKSGAFIRTDIIEDSQINSESDGGLQVAISANANIIKQDEQAADLDQLLASTSASQSKQEKVSSRSDEEIRASLSQQEKELRQLLGITSIKSVASLGPKDLSPKLAVSQPTTSPSDGINRQFLLNFLSKVADST